MAKQRGLNFSWLVKMAWRDSRRNRSRLMLFVSSIILGIAAMVAIYSLGDNMSAEVDRQAASLLGADLMIGTGKEVSPVIKKMVDSLGDRRSEQRMFPSMIYFTKSNKTRLVQVRALSGEFPYYGILETVPAAAGKSFRNGQAALVDQTMMLQYGAAVGDTVKVGNVSFVIAGTLINAPGQTGLSASVAPPVYIPLQYLEQTGLAQKGSRIATQFFFKFDKTTNMKQLVDKIQPRLDIEGMSYETVETQKQNTARSLEDLTNFLSLVSFIALLLGCVGVASAINIYVKEKIRSVAILRCLGAKGSQAFLIYLIQIVVVGFLGSLAGAALGTIIQQFLPIAFKDFLPIKVTTDFSWSAIGQGLLLGIVISFLFALSPLVSIRKISPLNTLRLSFQKFSLFKDPIKWLVYLLIILFIWGFIYYQIGEIPESIGFSIVIVVSFLILVGVAALLMWAVRRFFPNRASYLWRQGLANLYRPNNQTTILIVAIGLGTAIICTLFSVRAILLKRIELTARDNRSNTILFDIQPQQTDSVIALARQFNLPIDGAVPIVNMRLEKVNNITGETLRKDSTIKMWRGTFDREYRVTFRDSLTTSEKIAKGKWSGKVDASGKIFVSLDQNFAKNNSIKVGDTMTFNLQGSVISTIVGSLRQVDWGRVQTNFLVVFPTGVLEKAPQFHVLVTRVENKDQSAQFQQQLVQKFPNVTIIDLSAVLNIVSSIIDKVGFIIRFMAAFSIFTGLIVLIASVLISKYQRIQESVLLRTLGASRKQIFYITALEYFFLGALAAATGMFMSLGISFLVAKFMFETEFVLKWVPLLIVFVSVCFLTVFIGLINSRAVVTRPPLEILREEV
ncbi:MAG TPA: FtsX-like permease family protein [Chitinophagaceae bacterium]|nr:FtsX-like permease family protein [Chitinophagaceae bacterium]